MKKHFSALLLALGLCAAGTNAQNVTVVMKDGTSHKFNADYISEITFKEATAATTLNFTSLSLNVYSGGNVTLNFATDDGNTVALDIYGPADELWLHAGNYSLSSSNAPYTIDPAWSEVKIGGMKLNITDANLTVTNDEGNSFSFLLNATLSDGSEIIGRYTGVLDTYTRTIAATLSAASYNANAQPAGRFYVKFNDADWKYEMAIVFCAETSATTLPAGTYRYASAAAPGAIIEGSYVEVYNPRASLKPVAGSTVDVALSGEEYTITMDLVLSDGRTGKFTYTGKISGTPSFE